VAVSPIDEESLRARVALYELSSLTRTALHAWRHLKGSRLRLVLAALDDAIATYEGVHA
jgi:hypothetical protein